MENQDAASSESNSLTCPWKCSRGNVATLTLVTFLSLFPVSAQDRIDSFADSAPARIATLHVDRAGSEKRLARALWLLARSGKQGQPQKLSPTCRKRCWRKGSGQRALASFFPE